MRTSAAATANLSSVVATPSQAGASYFQAFPVPVRAADDNLPSVLGVPVTSGRWLDAAEGHYRWRPVI